MKELSTQEMTEVNGGALPAVAWFAAGVIARSAIGQAVKSTVKTAAAGFIGGVTGAAVKDAAE